MPYSDEVWKEALTYNFYINKILCSYRNYYGLERKDLRQEAIIGVCEAIVRRNTLVEKHEGSFKKYVKRCIKSHINTAIVRTGSLVRRPYSGNRSNGYFCHDLLIEKLKVESSEVPEKVIKEIMSVLNKKESKLVIDILSGMEIKEIAKRENVTRQAVNMRKLRLYKRIRNSWYE